MTQAMAGIPDHKAAQDTRMRTRRVGVLALACLLVACATATRMTPAQAAKQSDARLCAQMRSLTESYADTTRYGGYTNLEDVKLRLEVIAAEVDRRRLMCGP